MVTDNSQRLNYFLPVKDNIFDDLVNKIFINLKKEKNKTGLKSDLNDRLEINRIINSLYQAYFSIPPICVSLSLKKSKYSNSKISYTSLKRVFDYLKKHQYIKYKLGNEYSGKVTRIYPNNKLIDEFNKVGFVWRKYDNPTDNLLLFRDKIKIGKKLKAINLDIPINNKIKRYTNNISKINNEILKHCICLNINDESFKELEIELRKNQLTKPKNYFKEEIQYSLNFSQVSLRRIFSKNVNLHGRFYGGWWQSLPSKFRPHITIDGYKTAEADFSTLSLRILYALKKIPIEDNQDLYDIGINSTDEQRYLIKKYINALINDSKGTFRLDKKSLEILGMTHNQLKSRVYETHKPIAKKYFGKKDVGLRVMNLDSRIAEDIMLSYLRDKMVVLPIHDSFLIKAGTELDLIRQMKASFKKIIGVNTKIKSTGPLSPNMFNKPAPSKQLSNKGVTYSGEKIWELFNESYKFKRYNKYIEGWKTSKYYTGD